MKVRQVFLASAITAITLLAQGQYASATVVDLEAAQQANASLTNQWTFAGGSMADQEGSLDLNQTDAPTPGSIDYTGDRATFSNNNGNNAEGSALITNANLSLADNAAIEFVVTPQAGAGSEDQFIRGISFNGGVHRLYFFQNGNSLQLRHGQSGAFTILSSSDFVAGNDYYVAANFAFDNPGNVWTANVFVGNLTAGDALVTQTATNQNSGADGDPVFDAVLTFGSNTGAPGNDNRWSGSLDAVAIYGAELSGSEIAVNYAAAAAVIPEPSSFILMGMSVVGLGLIGRRRQQQK